MSNNITKKPEKLASAVYLISGFFSDQEPMKWKLRNLASDLVMRSSVFKDGFSVEEKRTVLDIRKMILELTDLLSVARNAGLVSDVNHSIISKELMNYMDILALPAGVSDQEGKAVLSLEFLTGREREEESEPQDEQVSIKDKTVKDTPQAYLDELKEERSRVESRSQIDEQSLVRPGKEAKPAKLKDFGAVSVKKNNRKSIIIGLLKRKKK